jgi:predicted HAD superfamily Cof-like phosphohydrolase
MQLTKITMKEEQEQVLDFMLRAQQDCPETPTISTQAVRKLRCKLIAEELLELEIACGAHNEGDINLVEIADAITDILVVTLGAAIAFGIDIQPCWDEVHRSNMSKFIDGYMRDDGKWIKGPSYSPANLKPIIEQQKIC